MFTVCHIVASVPNTFQRDFPNFRKYSSKAKSGKLLNMHFLDAFQSFTGKAVFTVISHGLGHSCLCIASQDNVKYCAVKGMYCVGSFPHSAH